MISNSIKKWQIVACVIVGFFLITNPSIKDFKDYLGYTSYSGLHRQNNFLVFSIYTNGDTRFLGILANIINITSKPAVVKPVVEESVHIDTAAAPGYISSNNSPSEASLQRLPYRDRVYIALCDLDQSFNTTKADYDKQIINESYVKSLYQVLKSRMDGFNRSISSFEQAMKYNNGGSNTTLPPSPTKDNWSQYEIKK